ncbi:exodeoxyribonuclease V subunit beta [Buchnera aphidicola (Brachycaudus cardui)]|uniref:RecBCD enzyme subunit RecB n=1 Tax=Buchnera aphidicola (Brachycaudus cardui) TaxID=557993 RepID=A0A4D6XSI3_9GAMM|nr:exodeoxyribonuclease V subunit beta [Buchnera aphidicola]QCI20582.1 exodeoxyribonuclease V subunit beta [Buchnera aphidicola (Brachycaudus cardui)]
MNIHHMKQLNIFKISMTGITLIEASAGTGKTFTIILLYLRLLLGIGEKQNNIKKLLIHEILVVTFTNAAKEELYIRIKNSIEKLYIACVNKKSKDPFCRFFLKKIHNIKEAIDVLKTAQNDINNISIYTIHGFCQQILQLHTFHFHAIFKEKIVENEDKLYLQATQDFWRCYFDDLPDNIIKIIYQYYNGPDDLLKKIKPFLTLPLINLKKNITNETIVLLHQKNIKTIEIFKKNWLNNSKLILKTINNLHINKKIYNHFNISRWINTITVWSKSTTENYTIPDSLKYFTTQKIIENTIEKTLLNHVIFKDTEKILKKNFSLKKIFILDAIKNISKLVLQEKEKKSLLGFNDLLSLLLKTIKKEIFLKDLISQKFPAVFIDEFQDTDIEQYEIFNIIYKKNKKTALFLIGDPKQAIYSFRGADIFSYLYAKSQIKKQYYLDTNWRSSINMSKSINFLFSKNNRPFIFENIPFIPTIPAIKNSIMNFTIEGKSQTPITFFFNHEKEIYLDDYQIWISKKCANEISYWLTHSIKKTAIIRTKDKEKILKANDIAILVRNGKEANFIQQELKKNNIHSIYSSSKNSVFQTFDAQELLWILQSILEPTNKNFLQQSSSTHILKQLLCVNKNMSKDESVYFLVSKLYEYYDIWGKIGIFPMTQKIILDYQKNSNDSEININCQKNFNFLHIAELLQEKFRFFYRRNSLIRWFQSKILQQTQPDYNENIRYLDESEAVKIITIHKSKGLEYPIVWIPFGIDFNPVKNIIYHSKKNFKTFFDIEKNDKNFKIAEEERLAEDIRFLYVALTRSTVHCSIGIGCLSKKKIKNRQYSDLHHSALGYIIQNGKTMNYENLSITLDKLSQNNLIEIKNTNSKLKLNINKKNIYLLYTYHFLNKNINNTWNITSFTQLQKENKLLTYTKKKEILQHIFLEKKITKLTIHNFPNGKKTGLMMHYILKNINYLNQKNQNWFSDILQKYNIQKKWTLTLKSWIFNIINIPLKDTKIILSELKKESYVTELEFFLPIKKILSSKMFNNIIQSADSISMISPKFFFNPITGILRGFIDLFFIYNKKYYILDYKSNWLGKDNNFYSMQSIKKEIINRRYDIQYQIYTVAIHKYLEKKIKNYNYQKDFGGVFYIFLRAVNNQENHGIFYTMPNYSLIKKLVTLMS